ncbi:MAG: hypothetical protein V4690_00525 [Patescibacteria group bacterium]
MKDFFKKIKEEKMTQDEKLAGLNSIKSFMAQHPVKEAATPSPFYHTFFATHRMLLGSMAMLVLIVSVTGGTSSVAQYALPGDLLYPVKINVNEKLESFMSFDTETKALVEIKHIDNRLMEAETLQTANKLDGTRKADIESGFKSDIKNAVEHINTLNSQGNRKNANKIKINIESSLTKYKGVVDKILEKKTEENNADYYDNKRNKNNKEYTSNKKTPEEDAKIEPASATLMMESRIVTETSTSTEKNAEVNTTLQTNDKNQQTQDSPDDTSLEEPETPILKSILERL